MSKPKKVTYTKHLVRYPKQDMPKTTVIRTSKPIIPRIDISEEEPNEISKSSLTPPISKRSSKFDIPEIHSSLNIGKKIDILGTTNQKTVLKEVPEKLTIHDKITKHVNFPTVKTIYKGLIPLTSPTPRNNLPFVNLREPLPMKDKEPCLVNFIEQKEIQEYSYTPNVRVELRKKMFQPNNLRLYKVIQTHNEKL